MNDDKIECNEPLLNIRKSNAGRPTAYSKEIATEIFFRIANGESLSSIARDVHMPAYSTILLWAADKRDDFDKLLEQAREFQGCYWADLLIDLSKKVENGLICEKAAKVISDNLKWTAERQSPRKYGARKAIDHTSSDGSLTPKESAPSTIIIEGVEPKFNE